MNASSFGSDSQPLQEARAGDIVVKIGMRVVLRPLRRADIFDMALAGKTAIVESIEQDFEDRIYVAVTLEDDPGRDLGSQKRPGHRFFFDVREVLPIATGVEP